MKKSLLSLQITSNRYQDFVQNILALARQQTSDYICVANVHMLVEAYRDKQFADVVNNAAMVTPDGVPLVWGLRLLHGHKGERVAGMDLLPDLLMEASDEGLGVFFYGESEATLQHTRQYLARHFPRLTNVHYYSPPFRPLTPAEEDVIVDHINETGARLVFVALGCPKQEKWMASMQGRIDACMIGIGGALSVMIGLKQRAPYWMQRTGLEWLYRLCQEPRRLFKRYAVTNTLFCWLLFKAWAKQGFRPKPIHIPKHTQKSSTSV